MNNRQHLDLSSVSDEYCIFHFRFTRNELVSITTAMGLPREVHFRGGTNQAFSLCRVLSLAIMLKRLAYPGRLGDMEDIFNINKATLGYVANFMIELLYDRYLEGIRFNKEHFRSFNLRRFSEAIRRKGSFFPDVVGFIDGTLKQIAKPTHDQEFYYNGKDKVHGLKYQAIVTPDGITVSIVGLFAGTAHDTAIFNQSGVINDLSRHLDYRNVDGRMYTIYGDSAYRENELIRKPFVQNALTPAIEKASNEAMESVRIAVEWEFGHVGTLFAFTGYSSNQRTELSNLGVQYLVSTMMKNIHICVNGGNQTSDYFNVQPPTLQEYIRSIRLNNI